MKRLFDLLCSLTGLVIMLPIGLIVSLCIVADSPGGVFFRQVRIGKGGKPFRIYKFRSMTNTTVKGSELTVGADSRITRVGRVIRKAKIDELPQLINVLIGDMSIVGPRPEVPKYVVFYSEKEREVFQVRPGITDLASIRFRNENDILATKNHPEDYYIQYLLPQKLELSRIYIEHQSFWLDLKIIFATLYVIITNDEERVLKRFFGNVVTE